MTPTTLTDPVALLAPMVVQIARSTARRFGDPDVEEIESEANFLFGHFLARFDPAKKAGDPDGLRNYVSFSVSRKLARYARLRAKRAMSRLAPEFVARPPRPSVDELLEGISAEAQAVVTEMLSAELPSHKRACRKLGITRGGQHKVAAEIREALACQS